MTVDSEGCLWVAFWDGWCLRRFSPAGERLAELEVPVQRPTSCAFGGPDLDQLFVTSARIGLDEAALESQPQAGGLFVLEPGTSGVADTQFPG
jgi:sugar lactone lactonase YvrE